MKKILLLSALLCFTFGSAHAQLTSTIMKQLHDPSFSMGRDFWFAMPSNEWGVNEGGKYMRIYITSEVNTIAWVEFGSTRDTIPIESYRISSINIPEAWEMESSGIVENKGIHIYSNDANLSVYFISHQAYSSDGSYVIPTIGWGTDYVVAAYGSLYEGPGPEYDLPSECTIVADEDNTIVNITPSCDCRQCTSGNINGDSDAKIVVYPEGQPQQFPLNRGQSMQLMPVIATDPDNFDMTGTVIHANHPIGVIGASMEPNIPADDPYGDFVCEMIPPIRQWGKTYYATNYAQPPDETDKDVARYLFIGSQPGQTIYRYDCLSLGHIECVITNQHGIYWDELELGEKFYSDEPFLCVSYSNSSTYPDGVNGLGDPAETVIPSREQFTKTVVFETPISVGNIVPYSDYVNIICKISDARNTSIDSKGILGIPAQCIDDTFEIFTIPKIGPGVHVIQSDSGVGVYGYGYGFDETYAWASPSGVATFHSPDSIAPAADTIAGCYQTFVHVADSGMLPDTLGLQSGLDAIWPDSSYNITFHHDADWIEGSGADTSGYTATVIDPAKPGILTVQIYDLAGNLTTVTTIYKALNFKIEPPVRTLGVWITGPPIITYDTIFNLGQDTLFIDELQLFKGNVGFLIFDSIGGPVDKSPLLPGQRRMIQIQFAAVKATPFVDSIMFGNSCELKSAALIAGLANDFSVSNQTWPNELLPAPLGGYPKPVTISNLSSVSIVIDSVWWADSVHFKPVSAFPIDIPASPGTATFTIAYFPDSNSVTTFNRTQGSWFSPQVLESGVELAQNDSLIGWAAPLSGVDGTSSGFEATVLPTNDGRSLEIILPADAAGTGSFELVNVLGESVLRETIGAGTQNVDASSLPRGVYFYRLTSGQMSQSGKVILGE